eukprot:gene29288-36311_t
MSNKKPEKKFIVEDGPKERNGKRERIATLIRERAEKKRLLELQSLRLNPPNAPLLDVSTLPPLKLTPVDPRFYMSKILMDSINTCDITVVEVCFRKHCHPEVICSLLYVGEMESNPMGPNSRVYVGVDILVDIYTMWFKVAPDNIYVLTGHSATYDRGTGIVTSNTEYTWQFTRVMEMNPPISDESIAIQEKLKTDLLMKTKRVSSSEHRDDMRVLSALEQSLEDAAQYKTSKSYPVIGSSSLDTSMTGDVKSHEVILPVNDIDWNDPEIDSFLDHIALDDDTLFFDSSHEVEDVLKEHIHGSLGQGRYASSHTEQAAAVEATESRDNTRDSISAVEAEFTTSIFSYESLQQNLVESRPAATIKEALNRVTSKPTLVKNIETFTYVGTFSVDIGKDGKV